MSANQLTDDAEVDALRQAKEKSRANSAASVANGDDKAAAHQSAHPSGFSNLVYGPGGAAMLAGSCEIVIFHPFDTAAKRLMSHRHPVFVPSSLSATLSNFGTVLFKDIQSTAPGVLKYVSHMYPGSGYAVAYKVSQRVIKFAGQPYMKDHLQKNYEKTYFNPVFGPKKGKMMLEATAGCLVGISEVILLPIDRMKVLNQTNKNALAGRSVLSVMAQEGPRQMYAGLVTTAIRNAPGSFLLFGGAALTKEYVFHLEDYRNATFFQNLVSSTVGSCLGVWFTSPIDVVKTRIQSQRFDQKSSGLSIVRDTFKQEGVSAFYKGITPKLITTAPRLVFSFTLTQYFTKLLRARNSQ